MVAGVDSDVPCLTIVNGLQCYEHFKATVKIVKVKPWFRLNNLADAAGQPNFILGDTSLPFLQPKEAIWRKLF